MDRKLERFFDEYDEIGHRLSMARERDFARVLRTWFACLDEAPDIISGEIRRLEALQSWDIVHSEVVKTGGSMVGSGRLEWPDNKQRRLGGQLLVLRKLASEEIQAMNFALHYFYSGVNNIDSHVHEMASPLFEPHAAELRRRLEDMLEDALADDVYVPASDRVVTLDHNSASFRRAAGALEETLARLRENNEMDPDDKTRIELELDSGLKMIEAPKTRIQAAGVVLVGALKWLVDRFASSLVGIAAARAFTALRVVLGI